MNASGFWNARKFLVARRGLAGLALGVFLGSGAAAQGAEAPLTLTTNGQPKASIVISAAPTRSAVVAALEVRDHIRKISGATLPILPDTATVTGPRILIGDSAATRALGLSNKDFKPQEYVIRMKGDDLILMGCDAEKGYGVRVNGNPKWGEGKFGKALSFDGKRDSLLILDPIGFDDAQGSMEAWVRPTDSRNNGTLFRLDNGSYHIVSAEDGCFTYVTYDGRPNGGGGIKSAKVSPGWHHVLATWDAAKGRKELFVDGKSAGTAAYSATQCAGAQLGIGAMATANANYFKGDIDEVRVSKVVRTPEGWDTTAPAPDATSLALFHFDEGSGQPLLARSGFDTLKLSVNSLPDTYNESDAQGTCYAAYHFLETSCGVRWFGPTEIGTVTPHAPTLTVKVSDVRRTPSFPWRNIMPVSALIPADALMPTVKALWGNPTQDEKWLYRQRMRNGGEKFGTGHTFYGYFDRFRHKNPKNPAVWEGQHLEWFAHGYEGSVQDPQMCFSSDEVVEQVLTDARGFFDGTRAEGGAGEYFALGPMDNNNFCKCPLCKKTLVNPAETNNAHFSTGKYSDYWFGFCNKVARGLQKTHPGKYASTLTYMGWAKHPAHIVLEPNVAIQLCLQVNNFWGPATERSEMAIYREWVTREKGRRIYLWLYAEFPEAISLGQGQTAFPGFNARKIGQQMKMYYKDGIRGLMPEGVSTPLNEYMYNQMAFDATQDPRRIIDEFFTLYYGAAATPMRTLWLDIEDTFSTSTNYPEAVQKEDKDFHQDEEMAWRYLGTAERMQRWAGYVAAAKTAAQTETEKARVQLFAQGLWEPMVKAKQAYDVKAVHQAEVDQLKKSPPPSARLPKLAAPANGDVDKVDWSQGTTVKLDHNVQGYPVPRQADTTFVRDEKYLYVRMQDRVDSKRISPTGGFWPNDDWEIFFAAQRGNPYRQVQFNPRGEFNAVCYGEASTWESGLHVVSEVKPNLWSVRLSIPLANVVPDGLKPGQKLYFNVVRASTGGEENLALSPTFSTGFHDSSRLADFTVE